MKKLSIILKIILLVLIFILIFGIVTFVINKKRVEEEKPPIPFTMVYKTLYADGGSMECVGLGYKINLYYYDSILSEPQTIYEIGDYNLKFDKDKNKPLIIRLSEIFFDYYYDLGNDPRTEEENKIMKQKFNECYEKYIKIYGTNTKSDEKIENVIKDYFGLDDSYKLYENKSY